jgi:asparagine synthase (glutamine-hydrolysing)
MDLRALKDIFTIGYVLAPKTLCGAIRQVLPGHYLLHRGGTVSIHQYWDAYFPGPSEIPQRSTDQWASALEAKLEETVRIHLRSDVPVGAWLSAGIDSSAVVGLASRILNRPIQTFSLAFENPEFDEVSTKKVLSDFPAFNLSNERAVCRTDDVARLPEAVWHGEDPRASGTEIPRLLLAQLAGRHVKVVLTGEGSDEVFGGYPWFTTHKLLRPFTTLPLSFRRVIAGTPFIRKRWHRASRLLVAPETMNLPRYRRGLDPTYTESFDGRILAGDVRAAMGREASEEDVLTLPKDFARWHPFAQLQYMEMKARLSDYINRYLDTTSMAYSQEARVPFLDHELVELCAQIPPALKMRGIREKYILRQAMRNVLPREIAERGKRGLAAPADQWMRHLPEFAVDLLSADSVKAKGYFDDTQVRTMVDRHRAGTASYARHLMGMLQVHLWDDLFRGGCAPRPRA